MMRVLFLSAPIGAGHIRAAQAVAKALVNIDANSQTEVANIFAFLPPLWGRLILNIYLKILDVFPKAYGMMYGWGNESAVALWGRKYVSRFLAGRLEKYLLNWRPDMIVCTHATPAGLIADLVSRGRLDASTLAVVTDFVVHRLWVYPDLDGYVIADESLREYLIKHGVAAQKISCLGIPVAEDFLQKTSTREATRLQLELDAKRKTILLMGGGAGLLPMSDIIAECAVLFPELQWIAVAGNNKKLQRKLQKVKELAPERIRVFGYTEKVAELMRTADLLISKPGGLTAAEALCSELPLIIYRPIPGQEEANSRFLTCQGTAFRAESIEEVKRLIKRLLFEETEALAVAAKRAAAIGHADAADQVAKMIKARIKIKNSEKC